LLILLVSVLTEVSFMKENEKVVELRREEEEGKKGKKKQRR